MLGVLQFSSIQNLGAFSTRTARLVYLFAKECSVDVTMIAHSAKTTTTKKLSISCPRYEHFIGPHLC